MRRTTLIVEIAGACLILANSQNPSAAGEVDPAAVERGRIALTSTGYLKPTWTDAAFIEVRKYWDTPAPDPVADPKGYAAAFGQRYGLHPAPYPNDGLPMGLRRANGPDGSKRGLTVDCMECHGGSIGGTSYVGLGNTQLDMKLWFNEMLKVDGRRMPPIPYVINSARGTINAGMFSVVLLSLRNSDLSMRLFPLPLESSFPEIDVPAWWILAKKSSMYYDGRTDARSHRSIMQFMLGEKSLKEFQELEPTFRDIHAYLKSLTPPKYPFPIDRAKAEAGKATFVKACAKCHGTYGTDGEYPNRVVELKEIGTDPARAHGGSAKLVAHYNSTWFGEDYPADEEMVGYQAPPLDGIWATAPYLHNGSVPTLSMLLKSSDRPAKFYRPPSTGFEHYDTERVGWKSDRPGATLDRSRSLFDTSRFGLGNGGHTYGDKLGDDERANLIEYLKTL